MGCDVPGNLRRDRQRDLESVADIVLAVGRHRHVGGDDEGVVAGVRDPVDQGLDAGGIAGQISLVPGGGVFAPDVLQRDQGRGGKAHRHVHAGGRARQHDVAAIGAQRGRAHRGNAERRRIGLAEQGRGLVAARDVVEHPRHETVFVEGAAIVAQCGVGLDGAGNVAVQEFRQPASGGRLEIVERKIALQMARHGALGALHGRRRGSDVRRSIVHDGKRSMFDGCDGDGPTRRNRGQPPLQGLFVESALACFRDATKTPVSTSAKPMMWNSCGRSPRKTIAITDPNTGTT